LSALFIEIRDNPDGGAMASTPDENSHDGLK